MMFNDLLFASFDTITRSQDVPNSICSLQYRTYIFNKLPTMLNTIANVFQSFPSEQFLQELYTDLQTLGHEEALAIVGPFLQLCSLHHLVPAELVQTLTGSDQSSQVAKGFFSKQALIDQVKANPVRGPRLIDELCKNDGNAGPMSQAVVELMHGYAQTIDTANLKDMCNAAVRQPASMNAIAMFTQPTYFLNPFCRLLDNWSWDEVHESQSMYEEFGSVLLLIMAFKFRLNLSNEDIGLSSPDGFTAQYLTSGQSEKTISQFTEDESTNMGGWLHNLYESEGINDEITSNCSAKEFYLMVPTLLLQSMTALIRGQLSQEKLEGGLDYLLEPFLIPSLFSSFAWLSQAVLKSFEHAMIIIRRLIRPPENTETNKLHRTILDIAHSMFMQSLSGHANEAQVTETLALFGDVTVFSAGKVITEQDYGLWCAPSGGIIVTLQQSLAQMLITPNTVASQSTLLCAAVQLRGPEAVVHSMVTLLVQFAANHQFPHLLDIVATLLSSTKSDGVSLRSSLQLLHARLSQFVKSGDTVFAEALVHLYRRTENYATALIVNPGTNEPNIVNVESVDMTEINLDQLPQENEMPRQTQNPMAQPEPMMNETIDQMLNDAVNMEGMEDYTVNDDNMFGLDNYDLANIDDLDMTMFQ